MHYHQQSLLLVLLAAVLVVATYAQVTVVPLSRQYTRNTTLLKDNYDIFWDIVGDELHMALSVKAQGWMGFGFYTGPSESATMINSDIILSFIDDKNQVHVQDSFTPQYSQPVADEDNTNKPGGVQDLTVVGGGFDAETERSIIEVKRKLITDDPNDYQLTEENLTKETKIIFAFHRTAKPTSFALGTFQKHQVNLTGKLVLVPDAAPQESLAVQSSVPIESSQPTTVVSSSETQAQESSSASTLVVSSIFGIVFAVAMMMLI
jgi:hypothetical protein